MKFNRKENRQFLISLAAMILPPVLAVALSILPDVFINNLYPTGSGLPFAAVCLLIGVFWNFALLTQKIPHKFFAVAGLLASLYLCWIFIVNVPSFIEAAPRAMVSRVRSDMRHLSVSIASYRVDHGAYPPHATGGDGFNGALAPENPVYAMPTFASSNRAWLPDPPRDSFLRRIAPGATFVYYTGGAGFILLSPGLDEDFDIDPVTDYSSAPAWNPDSLIPKTYDPTNGTHSDGDIFRIYPNE